MELNKKITVKILNVENPNRFWFRTSTDENKLQKSLNEYLKQTDKNIKFVPNIDDGVYVKWNGKFQIAIVKNVMDKHFIDVFGINCRETFRIQCSEARQLSEQLKSMALETIHLGSISGIKPAKEGTNCRLTTAEAENKFDWPQECAVTMTMILNSARSVHFRASECRDKCYYGELVYTNETNISNALFDLNFVIRVDEIACNGNRNGNSQESIQNPSFDQDDGDPSQNSNGMTNGNMTKSKSQILSKATKPNKSMNSNRSNVLAHEPNVGILSPITERNEASDTISSGSELSNGKTKSLCVENPGEFKHGSIDGSKTSNKFIESRDNESGTIVTDADLSERSTDADETAVFEDVSDSTFRLDESSEHSSEMLDSASCERFPIASSGGNDQIEDDTMSIAPSYLYVTNDSEEEPEYEYTPDEYQELDETIQTSVLQKTTDALLEHAKLNDEAPFTNIENGSDSSGLPTLAYSAIFRLNKTYPIQDAVWSHIFNGMCTILIGDTEYYPHLLYLPVICELIEFQKTKGDSMDPGKVLILASDQNQAESIRRISTCYLSKMPPSSEVYSNAIDYSDDLDHVQFRNCDIFVTLPNWFCKGSNLELLESVQCIVINNFQAIPPEHRRNVISLVKKWNKQFIITSKYYVEELWQIMRDVPDVFVSIESHFDLFLMTADTKRSRSTCVEPIHGNNMMQLRGKIRSLMQLQSYNRTVIVCRDNSVAESLSAHLKSKFNINHILNEIPADNGARILICSDDTILNFGVKRADHIIHYDLPDDFETFARRYIIFEKSHCQFPVHCQRSPRKRRGRAIMSPTPPTTPPPTSTVILDPHGTDNSNKLRLMFDLLSRENTLDVDQKTNAKFLKLAQNVNVHAPLCIDIAANFTNFAHLLNCKNRHLFTPIPVPQNLRFQKGAQRLIEILHVVSPVYFTVRILKCKDLNGIWRDMNSADLFEEFSKELNTFYSKYFIPLKNVEEIDKMQLYVVRNGDEFSRCKILDTNIFGYEKILVQLVDLGKPHRADILNIGKLQEMHKSFAVQSIDLCLLELTPWNKRTWNIEDTNYVRTLISELITNEAPENGLFEITILDEVNSELIFTVNLTSISNEPVDYVQQIISKGIASKCTNGLEEFFQHLNSMKIPNAMRNIQETK